MITCSAHFVQIKDRQKRREGKVTWTTINS